MEQHHTSSGRQEHPSLPPDMYETSVSTSASGSWSTTGSRRKASQSQKYKQSPKNGYHHGGHPGQSQSRQTRGRGRTYSPTTSSSPTSVPSTGSQGTPAPNSRGHTPPVVNTSQGPAPRRRTNSYLKEHDDRNGWSHAPPQSPAASSSASSRQRPVGYRQDYSRSQHAGIRGGAGEQQNAYNHSNLQHAATRDTGHREAAYTNGYMETHHPVRSFTPPVDTETHGSGDQSPSVSERIQKFNQHGYTYHDHESYHDEQQHRQHIYMEQYHHYQQNQVQREQQQQQPHPQQQHSNDRPSRGRTSHRHPTGPPQEPSPTSMSSPFATGENIGGHEQRRRAYSDVTEERIQYQESGAMPRHHLNHGMGGDVHPAVAMGGNHLHYEPHHPSQDHRNMPYQIPHYTDPHSSHPAGMDDLAQNMSLDDTIETPSVASVTEIRKRLWDDDESLQVAVKPSLQKHGDARGHWTVYYGPEMAGKQGQRMPGQEPQPPPPPRNAMKQRLSRSLSPHRPQYRSRKEQSAQQIHQDSASAAGADDNNVMFKTRFYQAAIAARRGGKALRSKSPPVSRPKNRASTPDAAAHAPSAFRPEVAENRQHTGEQHDGIERMYSQDPTSGGTTSEGSSVARLVAQLNAVSRSNPEEALLKIDSILRAESRSSSGGGGHSASPQPGDETRLHRHLDQQNPQLLPQHQKAQEEEESSSSDEESDDETSVSSITNPTFMSAKPSGDPEQPVPVPNISTAMSRRPRPNALQMYGQASPHVQHEPVRGKSSKKKKTPRSPPPDTIKVGKVGNMSESKGSKVFFPSQEDDTNGTFHSSSIDKPSYPQQNRRALTGPPTNHQKSPASIALKMWDDSSNPSYEADAPQPPPSSNSSRASESHLSTVNTEDLGSIVTPKDSSTASGVVNRRAHPWDDHIPQQQQQQQDKAAKGDRFQVNQALLDSDKPEKKFHAQNMSDDFDAAWVSLPSNAFFSASNKQGNAFRQQPSSRNNDGFRESRSTARHRHQTPPRQSGTGRPITFPPSRRDEAFAENPALRMPQTVSDAFAGKEDLLDDYGPHSPQARRNKLLKKLRKGKTAAASPSSAASLTSASSPQQPIPVFPGGSPTRTNKPLLSEHALDSVDGTNVSRRRRKSKSPGRPRFGSSSDTGGGTRSGFLAKKFSRLMKHEI